MLQRNGFSVEAAGDESEAINQLKQTEFNIILCGVSFPGMDGIEFIKRLTEHKIISKNRKIKYLIITAGHRAQAVTAFGIEHVISMPVHPSELVNRVHNLVKTKKKEPSSNETLTWVNANLENAISKTNNVPLSRTIKDWEKRKITDITNEKVKEMLEKDYEKCEIRKCYAFGGSNGICACIIGYYVSQGEKRLFSSNTHAKGKAYDQVLQYLKENHWEPVDTDESGRHRYFRRRIRINDKKAKNKLSGYGGS